MAEVSGVRKYNMSLVVRIDVDRPYGKDPLVRHVASKLSSDLWLPRIQGLGYLKELGRVLELLNSRRARSYVFFRRITLPSPQIWELIELGEHVVGLHLENSRSYDTFLHEKWIVEKHVGKRLVALSKHGSGTKKYGLRHYSPYEPEKYISWAKRAGMRIFFGNGQNPSDVPAVDQDGFVAFPSAFWLEPGYRNIARFSIEWLLSEGTRRDIVLLVHPENVLADESLTRGLITLLENLETTLI